MGLNHETRHAEIDALIRFSRKFNKIKKMTTNRKFYMCVFTTNRKGTILRHSECCQHCIRSIKKFSEQNQFCISKIFYLNINNKMACCDM